MSILNEPARWPGGHLPERELIARLAAASPEAVAAFLLRVIDSVIDELFDDANDRASAKAMARNETTRTEFDVPGGSLLWDAMSEADDSARRVRSPSDSLNVAVLALCSAMLAVSSRLAFRRDPARWRAHQQSLALHDDSGPTPFISRESLNTPSERVEAWTCVLRDLDMLNDGRPSLSLSESARSPLYDAVHGVAVTDHVDRLRELSECIDVELVTRRMAASSALVLAASAQSPGSVDALLASRVQLGFEGVTDLIYGTQAVIVAALQRRELHLLAEQLLQQISVLAAKEVGLARDNAERFVTRMRDELNRTRAPG